MFISGLFPRATVALVAILSVSSAVQAADSVAIKAGRIIPIRGPELENGIILVERGRITAVGKDLEIPFDAEVIDASDQTVFPGMVEAHTSSGLDRSNENAPVAPFLSVADSLDPSSPSFEEALRNGVTTLGISHAQNCVIGGMGRAVRPVGLTAGEMTVRGETGLMMSFSPKRGSNRMAHLALLRGAFDDLDDFVNRLAEKKYDEKLKEEDKKIDVGPEEARSLGRELIELEDLDDKNRNLYRLVNGQIATRIYCGRAMDVQRAVEFAKAKGFADHVDLVLGSDCHKAAAHVEKFGRPVILDRDLLHRERDRVSGKVVETFVPKIYADRGVRFALLTHSAASMGERYLWYQAARCVRHGVPRQVALESITLNPAEILDLGDRCGSIEVGKDANLLFLSGDPLDSMTWVLSVMIEGRIVYDRDRDIRLQELLRGLTRDEVAEESEESGSADSEEDSKSEEEAGPEGEPASEKPGDENEKSGQGGPRS